jgi:hypothetical protein
MPSSSWRAQSTKSQAPNHKQIASTKNQNSKRLELVVWELSVVWDLEFGA